VQVCADLAAAGSTRGAKVQALYGGRAYEPQVKALSEGVDVAVATPGRLLDLVNQGHLVLDRVRTLVLDEADEMLDLGFLPDVERIIRLLPSDRQTMLFSATMPGAVISLARQYMNRPTHIRAADPHDQGVSVANIKQFVYRAHDLDKIEMLARILQANGRGLTMVFARTKRAVARITEELQDRHFAVGAVHGDLAQGAREQALRAFRNGKVDVLVATDVAARGIDVEGVTHVVNYQCPEDEKVYTHRIGRTGRAGRTGISVTLVDWEDMPRWGLINKALGLDLAEPVELYSTSPQLFADLDIPQGVKGALPKQDRVRAGLEAEELEDLGETGRHAGGGRGGRGGKRGPETEQPEPRRERTPRQRRRTRSGQSTAAEGTIAVHTEREAAMGAAPVVQSQTDPFHPPTLEPVLEAPAEEKPKRTRTRKRATAAEVVEAVESVETVEAAPVAEASAEQEKPKRTRTRKRTTAAVAEPVAQIEPVAEPVIEAAPAAEAPAEDKPARKRTRKRVATVDAPVAEPIAEPIDGAAAIEDKPARKRAPRKTAAKKVVAAGAEPAVAEKPAARKRPASPAKSSGNARGGSIRLAPGSLADPKLPEPEPVRTAPVNEPVELTEPVFTQEPILPNPPRAPRKRTAKKSVAAQPVQGSQVTSTLPGEAQGEPTILDPLNVGPVANRRRTQI
jgi:superfamily II DNA/RNA helicase